MAQESFLPSICLLSIVEYGYAPSRSNSSISFFLSSSANSLAPFGSKTFQALAHVAQPQQSAPRRKNVSGNLFLIGWLAFTAMFTLSTKNYQKHFSAPR